MLNEPMSRNTMKLAIDSETDSNAGIPAVLAKAEPSDRKALVPYIVSWSAEQVERPVIVDRWVGIGYADESAVDRDRHGVLWRRQVSLPGVGRPMFGQVHPVRQRRAMRRLLCSICAGPADRSDRGWLWLLRDYREDWPGWPDGMGVVEPPVCKRCARYSVGACPELRKGWLAVRVGHSVVAGVYGARYRAAHPGPAAVEDTMAVFDDPAIRWTCAAQLVREITECTIVDLETECRDRP